MKFKQAWLVPIPEKGVRHGRIRHLYTDFASTFYVFVYQDMERVELELEIGFLVEDSIFQQNIYTKMKTVTVRLDKKWEHLNTCLASC